MARPRLLIFASGTKDGGGSGFDNLMKAQYVGDLKATIVGIVSNHANGGVRKYAKEHDVQFMHFPAPWSEERVREIIQYFRPDFVALSGWLKLLHGLDSRVTFNIHPGPLPRFGGRGMYGIRVHREVIDAYRRGEITYTQVCMHFVTAKYDEGRVFFRRRLRIRPDDTPESLQRRVLAVEHRYQPLITNSVIHGQIRWDGKNPRSLTYEKGIMAIGTED